MPHKKSFFRRRFYLVVVAVAVLLNFGLDLLGLYESFRIEVLAGITIDLAIITLLGLLFWVEQRARARTELALKRTIEHLDATNNLLLRSDAFKTRLLRTTIHDLKNPLGSIRGFAELLHDEPQSRDSVVEMSETIRRISDNTLDLVNTLVNEKSIKNGQIQLNKISTNIIPLIKEICARLNVMSSEKDQKLIVTLHTEELYCEVDPLRIADVFNNIVGNAIKFSPAASNICVRSSCTTSHLQITIDDQGPGMSAQDKLKAFQPGQTLSARPTGHEVSTGMGLFSAKQNVELHGGTIRIADNPEGKGTRFVIEWPIHESPLVRNPDVQL